MNKLLFLSIFLLGCNTYQEETEVPVKPHKSPQVTIKVTCDNKEAYCKDYYYTDDCLKWLREICK